MTIVEFYDKVSVENVDEMTDEELDRIHSSLRSN